jgi:TonB family protein
MKPMEMPRLLRAAIPAAVLSVMATHAHAQQDERIGNVDVHLQADSAAGTDLGFAMLKPDGGAVGGALVWACAGDPPGLAAGVYLDRGPEDTASVNVAWRFDQDPPDTTELRPGGTVDLLRSEDAAPLILRARTAERLTLHVLNGPAAEHAYTLAGVDSALHRLGCGAGAEPGARPAGTSTLLRLMGMADGPDPEPVSGLGVGEDPRPRNVTTFTRQLERNYPPLMRDAGVVGDVVLRFRVLEDGRVDSASVQSLSSSMEQFEVPSIRSVRSLTFFPARVNGRPVKVWTVLPIRFEPGVPPRDPNPRLQSAARMNLVYFVLRNHPAALRDACVQGQADVRFRVQANGQPDPASVEVSRSSHALLDDVAIRAVGQLRYDMPPPPADGQPVNDQVLETIRFLLPSDCQPKTPGAAGADRP